MYVDNGKISSRQLFRLYVFDLMGIATLLLPSLLAEICGVDGVFAILIGTVAGFVYLLYLGWIMKKMEMDMCSFLLEKKGKLTRGIVLVLIMLHCLLTAGFCANVFANLMQYSLIKEASFGIILMMLVIVAAYAVSGGIESRARVYEVLFWFVLIPYIVMMFFPVKDFEFGYINSFFEANSGEVLLGSFLVFLFLTPLFFSLFLVGEGGKENGKSMVKTVSVSILVSAVVLLGSYVLLVGNFGVSALASMDYPVITLMSTIQFRGNFVKRMDAFMVAVWFFTLFALLNLHLHYGVTMLKELAGKKEHVKTNVNSKKLWQILVPALVVLGIGYGLQFVPGVMDLFLKYYIFIAVPAMILGPVLLLLGRR